jgi:hypothetical protein
MSIESFSSECNPAEAMTFDFSPRPSHWDMALPAAWSQALPEVAGAVTIPQANSRFEVDSMANRFPIDRSKGARR